MVSLGRKTEDNRPESIICRLLPTVLDPTKLEKKTALQVLDFGRANSATLAFFNQYPCRLCVLDAAETLLEWSESVAARMEEPPSASQMRLELSNLLSSIGDYRYDVVFLWDTLNHLHPHALDAFGSVLRRHVTTDFKGHGFMLHKKGTPQFLRQLSLQSESVLNIREQESVPLYAHNRKQVNEALEPDLKIDHGVLHGDGRLEFVVTSGVQVSQLV
ncbi:MAG: hypothetical protein AAGG55_00480 [Pseudomonadota bacterium]